MQRYVRRDFFLVEPGAGGGHIYVRMARPDSGSVPGERHLRLSRLAKRCPAGMDVRKVPGGAPRKRAPAAQSARVALQPLLYVAGLPGEDGANEHPPGRTLRPSPRSDRLHISNEYGGECHCPLCQAAFRKWLKNKYGTLQQLNHDWWTTFWSHTYSFWEQIESPAPHGETMVHGLNLDWKRFVNDQTIDFYEHELRPFREANPKLPATANFMEAFDELDYAKFAKVVDFISWDSYPTWHYREDDTDLAAWVGMNHDWFRSMKDGQPFFLMESTPSTTNWQPLSKLKKPGVHMLSSLQAVAHGSNSVQYFQWRKSRGSSEKFHGAVVDHAGHEETRVFREVAALGQALEAAGELAGTTVQPEVAVIFDTENRWAVKDAQGPRNSGVHYEATVKDHYKAFWKQGVPVDMIDMDKDLSPYKVLVAPMLYMVREGVGEKITEFVKNGGTLITTYWSGIVDEHDLCFLGGFPGPLREVLGIWSEEIDSLGDGEENTMVKRVDVPGLGGEYTLTELCDLIHTEGAEVLASYRDDFYAGRRSLATVTAAGRRII